MKKWLSVLALCLLPVYAMAAIVYDSATNTYTVSGSNLITSNNIKFDKTGASSGKIIFESGSSLETKG